MNLKRVGKFPTFVFSGLLTLFFVSFCNHTLTHADSNMCTTVCSGVLVFQNSSAQLYILLKLSLVFHVFSRITMDLSLIVFFYTSFKSPLYLSKLITCLYVCGLSWCVTVFVQELV